MAPSTFHPHQFFQLCFCSAPVFGDQYSDHHSVQHTSTLNSTSPEEKTLKDKDILSYYKTELAVI